MFSLLKFNLKFTVVKFSLFCVMNRAAAQEI